MSAIFRGFLSWTHVAKNSSFGGGGGSSSPPAGYLDSAAFATSRPVMCSFSPDFKDSESSAMRRRSCAGRFSASTGDLRSIELPRA